MKSTGEVMGVGDTFAEAFFKAVLGAGVTLPKRGRAFLSVKESDRSGLVAIGRELSLLGFRLVATHGTAQTLRAAGIETDAVNKVGQGRPHVADLLKNEQIDLIVNTTEGHQSIRDSAVIRRLALQKKVCYTTTVAGGEAYCIAIRYGIENRGGNCTQVAGFIPLGSQLRQTFQRPLWPIPMTVEGMQTLREELAERKQVIAAADYPGYCRGAERTAT